MGNMTDDAILEGERNLIDVCRAALEVIPADWPTRTELSADLERLFGSVRYSPPEMLTYRWHEAADIFSAYVGTTDAPWANKSRAIFRGDVADAVGEQAGG